MKYVVFLNWKYSLNTWLFWVKNVNGRCRFLQFMTGSFIIWAELTCRQKQRQTTTVEGMRSKNLLSMFRTMGPG